MTALPQHVRDRAGSGSVVYVARNYRVRFLRQRGYPMLVCDERTGGTWHECTATNPEIRALLFKAASALIDAGENRA